ncbi:SGNH/GDSL hydrolase family protein [Methylocystis echinoides]|uniref:SGNH/GDSL hydrolase family protein n=1 Tax=Methylocystis echinoides TaxID=29468 RepID=UPI0034136437
MSPIRPGVIHEKKIAANGDVIFDVSYTIKDDLTRKVDSAQGPLVAFFGDSFTYGAGVNDGDTLPQIFADLTKGAYHVVNFGVSGYGPQQTLRALETDLYPVLKENPRLFVIQTAPWHAFRTSCKADNAWFGPSYELENGEPVYRGSCASRQSTFRRAMTTLLRWTEAYDHFIGQREKPVEPQDMELYIDIIARAADIAKQKYGVPTIVLYLPDDLSNPRYHLGPSITNAVLMERLRQRGVKVVDLMIDVTAYPGQQLIIPGDGHPTGLLNRIWGERLRDYVASEFTSVAADAK